MLCLPEMVLTGYNFPSAEAIKPYLEQPGKGPTSACCKILAKRLRCHVMAGYPEVLSSDTVDEDNKVSDTAVGYNSAIIYGPDGEVCGGYRKTNMFRADLPWARAGNGFGVYDLGNPLGRVSLGICMDLNPSTDAVWTTIEDGPYELASFALDNNTPLVVVLCAWLDSDKSPSERSDYSTLSYWATRLIPLWKVIQDRQTDKETIVVVCNRSGYEGDSVFAGTSAIFRFSQENGPEIVGMMSRSEESVRIWEV